MSSSRVVYRQRPDIGSEQARTVRAAALRFAIAKYLERQRAAGEDGGEKARKEINDSGKPIIPNGPE